MRIDHADRRQAAPSGVLDSHTGCRPLPPASAPSSGTRARRQRRGGCRPTRSDRLRGPWCHSSTQPGRPLGPFNPHPRVGMRGCAIASRLLGAPASARPRCRLPRRRTKTRAPRSRSASAEVHDREVVTASRRTSSASIPVIHQQHDRSTPATASGWRRCTAPSPV